MKNNLERRRFAVDELRVEPGADGAMPVIRMAIKFNTPSVPLGGMAKFREILSPTAFDGALNDPSVELLSFWNHNTDLPLGRRSTGTLRISKTDTLFKAEIDPPDTTWGRDAVASITRGDVQGMSFEFSVHPEGQKWSKDANQMPIRTLTNVEIFEVSPTARPAYPKSMAATRSADEVLSEYEAEIEKQDQARRSIAEAQFADRQRRDRLHRTILTAKS